MCTCTCTVCGEGGTDPHLHAPYPPKHPLIPRRACPRRCLSSRGCMRGPTVPARQIRKRSLPSRNSNRRTSRLHASRRVDEQPAHMHTHAHTCTRTRPRTRTRTRTRTCARASPACERRLAWPSARMPFSSLHTGTARYQRRWRRQPRQPRRDGRHGRHRRERRLQAGGRGARGLHPHLEHPPVDERRRDARDGGDRRATAGVRP